MAGVPLLFGFIAKEQFYQSVAMLALPAGWTIVAVAAAVMASACLGAAGLIAGVGPFAGRQTPSPAADDAPPSLWLGPLFLAIAGLLAGIVPAVAAVPIGLATASITGTAAPVSLAVWHGFTTPLLLSAVTLVGSVALFMYRESIRRFAWPRALRTERLYSGTLSGIDAISRRIAPALQSASLRSYVLTVLVTAVAFITTALAAARILPTPRRWTPIHLHEGVVAALIVAAALSAVFARSTMAAVLSLGAVGYGIALMYALFGAPDLAMTQFAVETLIVVIFVLVFHQLRGFGDLSSPLVRTRDAVVAASAGTLVTTLVLFIGASGTTSRLSSFFAETAPRLAHGRNVVNVILVDFRGFDTLGEITVLVTVAIGVRALLLIARDRRS
jgi:multicomponent Na+:H+ antiporter subunit A